MGVVAAVDAGAVDGNVETAAVVGGAAGCDLDGVADGVVELGQVVSAGAMSVGCAGCQGSGSGWSTADPQFASRFRRVGVGRSCGSPSHRAAVGAFTVAATSDLRITERVVRDRVGS